MVMEASPSPQSVGREFVRQYYTLLNKAPSHLHRFYNNFSSFVHGGLDAPNRETLPVIGQKQIHNRIQQLNFRDCHAKISQVDSQATLGNGVVVQVTGELSNGGAPMRRFTQTFVLAAQSPKKYYVHNDIFRYQDIVFSDEEGSGDNRSEGEEEESRGYFPPPPTAYPSASYAAPPAHLNGHPQAVHEDTTHHLVAALQGANLSAGVEPENEVVGVSSVAPPSVGMSPVPPPEEEYVEPEPEPSPSPPQPVLPTAAPEPKTYANLLKSGGLAQSQAQPMMRQFVPYSQPNVSAGPVAVGASSPPERPRPQRPPRDLQPPTDGAPVTSGGGGGGGRRYSDAQQLFLGHLPHCATEDELRALFGRFGAIAELRVHSKPAPPGAPKHPNYGFITYEQPQAAHNCLHAAPLLYYPADSTEGVKLNVEEKKMRAGRGGDASRARPAPHRAPRPPFPPRAPYRR